MISKSPVLETRDLWKTYQVDGTKVEALRGVSLTLEAGDFTILMGPSGSGKTTLVHLIGGMDKPTRGEIKLDAQSLTEMRDAELTHLRCHKIGFIFQNFNLMPTLTAQENVEMAMRLAGVNGPERRKRASSLMEQVGLSNRSRHLPQQLSGGERQRAAIARALANHPHLLIADEPTGNLDSVTGGYIVALLHRLNSEGQTVIMVTHNAELAAQGGRILRMKDGKILC